VTDSGQQAPHRTEPSAAQRSLWFLDRMTSGQPLHVLAWRIGLTGALDTAVLRRAFEAVAARHDSLRTGFAEHGHGPVRVVHDRVELPFAVEDLRGAAGGVEAAVRRRCAQEASAGFDLSAAPLLRVAVLRTGEEQHELLLAVHHIVFDGASLDVLLAELGAAYGELLAGGDPGRAPLPAQYGDFCAAQRELLAGPGRERPAAHWRAALDGAPPLLDLPTDRLRGPEPLYRSASCAVRLDADAAGRLRVLRRTTRSTTFTVLLAAFQVVLARRSGQADVSVGVPVSGRTRSAFEPVIGFFANSVVMRGLIGADEPFTQLVRRTRETFFDALDHQELPFEAVVEELRPERTLSHTPLFQVVFALQDRSGAGPQQPVPGVTATEPELLDSGHLPFEMVVTAVDTGSAIDVRFEYAASLYDEATVLGLAREFRQVLAAAAEAPDTPVGRLARSGADGAPGTAGASAEEAEEVGGYRVVPSRIAAVLGEHPGVREAVVVVREDRPGERVLTAYAVPGGAAAPTGGELHAHLAARLADHLVPSAVVLLDALPADRAALPAPGAAPGALGAAGSPAVERVVLALWGQVLGMDDIVPDDDFFGLGGHSLSAATVAGTLQELFEVELSASAVFHDPTPRLLAARLTDLLGGPQPAAAAAGPLLTLMAMSDEEAERALHDAAPGH